MRTFYEDEGPIDTLLQLGAGPVWDGNLVSKSHRDLFVEMGWAARCEGYNIITTAGVGVIRALRLRRMVTVAAPQVQMGGMGSMGVGQCVSSPYPTDQEKAVESQRRDRDR